MTEYTASNGYRIVAPDATPATRLEVYASDDKPSLNVHRIYNLGKYTVDALREYFQAERDNELGRVRDALGGYVIYPHADGQRIRIMDEASGQSWEYWRDFRASPKNGPALIASVYFSSHPEPKAWHDAKPGEVWAITTRNVADECAVQVTPGRSFTYNDAVEVPLTYEAIETARRIWPEEVTE